MKTQKRVLALVVALVFVISMFAGCGNNDVTTKTASTATEKTAGVTEEPKVYAENGLPMDQEVTLKVGFWEAGYGREWYDNCVAAFTKKFPNVKFETQYSPTIQQIVKTKIAAENDDDMFDMFYYDWNELVKVGKVEPVEDLLEREPYDAPGKKVKDILTPGICESLTYYADKHLYYLPQTTYVGGLFFDQNLFEQNGWNKNPKTWSEFLKLCEDIKGKGIVPIAYAGIYDYEKFAFASKQFELAAVKGNTGYLKNFRNYVMPFYASAENLEAWNRISELGKKGYIDAASVSMNHTQSQMMAIQHKAAMVPSGDWIGNEMKKSTPNGFKWGFMGVPFIDNPDQAIYLANGVNQDLLIYSKKPELNKKWAKEFMLWLYNIESQQQIVEKGGALSLRKDFLDDASRVANLSSVQKSVSEYIKNNKVALVAIENFDIQLTHPNLNKARKLMTDSNGLMATGKKDPQAILNECDKILKEAVDAYHAENK